MTAVMTNVKLTVFKQNKKMKKSIVLYLIILLISSCNQYEFNDEQDEYVKKISLTTVTESEATRAYIEFPSSVNYNTTALPAGVANFYSHWFEPDDTFGIFPQVGDQIPFALSNLTAPMTNPTFDGTGWQLRTSYNYYAYSPFSRKNYVDGVNIDHVYINFFGQKLDSITARTNGGLQVSKYESQYDYLYSTPTISDPGGNLLFSFYHIAAPVRAMLRFLRAGEPNGANTRIRLVKLIAKKPFVTMEGTYDLDSVAAEKAAGGSNVYPIIRTTKRGWTNVICVEYDSVLVARQNATYDRVYFFVMLPHTDFNVGESYDIVAWDQDWNRFAYRNMSITKILNPPVPLSLSTIIMSYEGQETVPVKIEPWEAEDETINSNWNYK